MEKLNRRAAQLLTALCVGVLLASGAAYGQQTRDAASTPDATQASSDAQTETNVVIALDSWSALKGQEIAASTIDGDVTLTGTVKDASSKALAERVADRISGVRSVRNDLTVASSAEGKAQAQNHELAQAVSEDQSRNQAENANDPSRLEMQTQAQSAPMPDSQPEPVRQASHQAVPAPAKPQAPGQPNISNASADVPRSGSLESGGYPYPSGPAPQAKADLSSTDQTNPNSVPPQNQPESQPENQPAPPAYQQPSAARPSYDRGTDDNRTYNQGGYDGGTNSRGAYDEGDQHGRDQSDYDRGGNDTGYGDNQRRGGDRRNDQRAYGNNQRNPGPVTLPPATLLRVRTSEFLDVRKLQPGSAFEATAAQDVFVSGVLAVPRGATLHGVVTDLNASNSGSMTGSTSLTLKLTDLELEGRSYPLSTETSTVQGPGKGAYSANNTVGGAAIGAVIGAIIGRGPGAAIGAIAGGATGAAASSASAGPRMVLAPETVLTFHLGQPVTITPVSSREAQRLASAGQPQGAPYLRQRSNYPPPPPPPPPYYYGPRYYPYGPRW